MTYSITPFNKLSTDLSYNNRSLPISPIIPERPVSHRPSARAASVPASFPAPRSRAVPPADPRLSLPPPCTNSQPPATTCLFCPRPDAHLNFRMFAPKKRNPSPRDLLPCSAAGWHPARTARPPELRRSGPSRRLAPVALRPCAFAQVALIPSRTFASQV